MELKEIQNLIKFVAKSGANEVKLEMGDVKITIKTGAERHETNYFQQTSPVSMPVQVHRRRATQHVRVKLKQLVALKLLMTSKYIEIKSPIIGHFYRKPSPDKPVLSKLETP